MRFYRSGHEYCRGGLKRLFDILVSVAALILTSPLLLLITLLNIVLSTRPVLFTQVRVGMDGKHFRILKFRTMRHGSDADLQITARDDMRVTPLGRILRSCKLDELPQFLNVLRGEMSIVGPRPEVHEYVQDYSARQRFVLSVRPGLTDPATIAFRDEESRLARVGGASRDRFYREKILPQKLDLNIGYIERATFLSDLAIITRTVGVILFTR